MKKATLLAFLVLASRALCDPSGITGSCRNGGTFPKCDGGEVVFSGTGYAAQVHIKVTNSSGKVIDDGDYTTDGGVLSFTENLSFADVYSIAVNGTAALTVSTN